MDEQGLITYMWVHHKSSNAGNGVGAGPICPSPPPGTITEALSLIVLQKALPYLYSIMEGVPRGVPLPTVPNFWASPNEVTGRALFSLPTLSSFALAWRKLLTTKALIPQPPPTSAPWSHFKLLPHPFQPGPYSPGDNRRLFITSFVENQVVIMRKMEQTGADMAQLRKICARQVGNSPKTWHRAYDLLIKIREQAVTQAMMHALNGILTAKLVRWRQPEQQQLQEERSTKKQRVD